MLAQGLVDLLNADITPWVPEHGSLGASGDLAPLAHCALVLLGEGWVVGRDGARGAAGEALRAAGLRPLALAAKEGLALINGTDGMLGMLLLAIADARHLFALADVTAAFTVYAASTGTVDPNDPEHRLAIDLILAIQRALAGGVTEAEIAESLSIQGFTANVIADNIAAAQSAYDVYSGVVVSTVPTVVLQ